MPKSQLPPFDPLSLPESNASQYPEPFLSLQEAPLTAGSRIMPGSAISASI